MWSGLKGAVPILLASLAVAGGTEYAREIYGIVFVVVLARSSSRGQGCPSSPMPSGCPCGRVDPETMDARRAWSRSRRRSPAAGTLAELPLAERAWVSEIERDGRRLYVAGRTKLEPGDAGRRLLRRVERAGRAPRLRGTSARENPGFRPRTPSFAASRSHGWSGSQLGARLHPRRPRPKRPKKVRGNPLPSRSTSSMRESWRSASGPIRSKKQQDDDELHAPIVTSSHVF